MRNNEVTVGSFIASAWDRHDHRQMVTAQNEKIHIHVLIS